jgi:hypothetical protein
VPPVDLGASVNLLDARSLGLRGDRSFFSCGDLRLFTAEPPVSYPTRRRNV